jgi:hypothetical protein
LTPGGVPIGPPASVDSALHNQTLAAVQFGPTPPIAAAAALPLMPTMPAASRNGGRMSNPASRKEGASPVIVRITPNDKGNPPGKLADAELHFTEGPLEGLKLIGFAVWERRGGGGGRNVTFPARQYSVNGERRSFALLRPILDSTAQNRVRDLILEAFQEYEERAAIAS